MSEAQLTGLLQQWRMGDRSVESKLMDIVYPILRAFAHKQLGSGRVMTMQPTELAHEAYFKLSGQREVDWQNRGHFFAIAGRIVRHVVIDYLRERGAEKRGAQEIVVSIDHLLEADIPAVDSTIDWLRIDQVLTELEAIDPDSARIVEMRYFAGLSLEETALATGVSRATVVRQWRTTRAWLHDRMQTLI
jgi:RNA polymerase sigma factor (TIGR02999 family)